MTRRAIARAFGAAFRRPALAAAIWIANLLVAAIVLPPAWLWWRPASMLPETDPLLDRVHIGLLVELWRANPGGLAAVLASALVVLMAAVLLGPFVTGGVIDRLLRPAESPAGAAFVAGGAHLWARFLRLELLTVVVAIPAAAMALLTAFVVMTPVRGAGPTAALIASAIELLAPLAVAGVLVAVQDAARLLLAASADRSAVRAWLGGVRFVARHPVVLAGLGAAIVVCWAALTTMYVALTSRAGAATGAAIAGTIALQQALIFVRGALRVGWLAGLSDAMTRV